MLLNSNAGPVPAPCASRAIVPSSMFQSTSPLISRMSPYATGFRFGVMRTCLRRVLVRRTPGSPGRDLSRSPRRSRGPRLRPGHAPARGPTCRSLCYRGPDAVSCMSGGDALALFQSDRLAWARDSTSGRIFPSFPGPSRAGLKFGLRFCVSCKINCGAAREIMTSTTKLRDGTRLVYDIHGRDDGRPRLVLIHSLGMDRFFWERVNPIVADDAAILTYDCRGHGASDKPKGPYRVEGFADDLAG